MTKSTKFQKSLTLTQRKRVITLLRFNVPINVRNTQIRDKNFKLTNPWYVFSNNVENLSANNPFGDTHKPVINEKWAGNLFFMLLDKR